MCNSSGCKLLLRLFLSYNNKVLSRVAFRILSNILSNIHNGALLHKQPTALKCWLFPQKSFTAQVRLDFKCASEWRYCKCGVQVDCKCMEFVTADWCTGKQSGPRIGFKCASNIYLLRKEYISKNSFCAQLRCTSNIYMTLLLY